MANANLYLILALLIAMFLVVRSLLKRDKSAASPLRLDDLLLGDDGRLSKAATVMFGAFLLTSWVVIYQTISNQLTELSFGAYLTAWVAPTVTRLIANRPTQ